MPGYSVTHLDVLLVEDDEEDYLLTKDVLDQIEGTELALHWVCDQRSALGAVAEREFDVCLVDYRLGPEDGIELIRELVTAGHDLPVIVMTGQGDRDVDVAAARAGAADYLVKGEVTPALLERAIRYAMRSRADLRALRQSEAELRQAQRMDAVGQLAGGVAHDFNNMMTAVMGFSSIILDRLEDAHPLRRHVEEIMRAGERASAMTHQLLAFSRKQVLQPRVLDLNTVIVEVKKLLQHLIGEDVELVSVLEPVLEPIEADPGQLEQVIMNLAINARDAMPAGGRLYLGVNDDQVNDNSGAFIVSIWFAFALAITITPAWPMLREYFTELMRTQDPQALYQKMNASLQTHGFDYPALALNILQRILQPLLGIAFVVLYLDSKGDNHP